MELKIITRNLNFDTDTRNPKSEYRVKFGIRDCFKILRVVCNYNGKTKIYETASTNLPLDNDSIYFLADKIDEDFIINWNGNAGGYMKEV